MDGDPEASVEFELAIASAVAGVAVITSLVLHHHSLRLQKRKRRICENDVEDIPRYRPPIKYVQFEFNLDTWTDNSAEEYLRFTKAEIRTILPFFNLNGLKYPDRCRPTPELALCITLCRLSSPTRYKDHFHHFGRSRTWQCDVFNTVVCYLADRYRDKLRWDKNRLTLARLRQYCDGVKAAGGPDCIWGFVDGTMRVICRPTQDQREYYTGYKKAHAIKYQGIMTTDGIISSLIGPYEGKLGDWAVWHDSGVELILRQLYKHLPIDEQLYIYGDPAYTLSFAIMGAYKATVARGLTEEEKAQNAQMSSFRIAVEHGFGKVVNLWAFIAFRNGLKIGLSPVGSYYSLSVLLTNIHTCLRGSQVTSQFNISPPSVEEYLYLD